MAQKRLVKEMAKVQAAAEESGVSASLVENDVLRWQVVMQGPADSPYAGGLFFIDMTFPADFPFKPPKVKFSTKIYHANITDKGEACLSIIKDDWSPMVSVLQVIAAIRTLLLEPIVDSPQMPDIAALYKDDKPRHDAIAAEWTRKYAQ